jgi:6-phosphogluconolactonase
MHNVTRSAGQLVRRLKALSPMLVAVLVASNLVNAQVSPDTASNLAGLTITAQYLYAAGSSTDHTRGLIAGYRVGSGGTLTPTGQVFPIREGASTLLQSAQGAKLFASSFASIWSFAVRPTTGVLQFISVARFPANVTLAGLAINPQSTLLFAVKNTLSGTTLSTAITAYRIGASGSLTAMATTQVANLTGSVVVDRSGRFVYAAAEGPNFTTAIAQLRINAANGALTPVNTFPVSAISGNTISQLAVHPNGKTLYAATGSFPGVDALSINTTTGALSEKGFAFCGCDRGPDFGGQLVVDPRGTVLFEGTGQDAGISVYTINQTTGLLTPVPASFQLFRIGPVTLSVDGTGRFLYGTDQFAATISGFTVTDAGGVTPLARPPVPLPSSMAVGPVLQVVSVRR